MTTREAVVFSIRVGAMVAALALISGIVAAPLVERLWNPPLVLADGAGEGETTLAPTRVSLPQ